MVALNFNTDPNNLGSSGTTNEPVAPGKYQAEILDATVMQSKANPANSYLSIEWKLIDSGRHVWDILNLWNSNPKAVEIAVEKMNRLGVALHMPKIGDTEDLLLKSAILDVGLQSKDQTRNEIYGYEQLANIPAAPTAPAPATVATPQPQTVPAPASATTPPWA